MTGRYGSLVLLICVSAAQAPAAIAEEAVPPQSRSVMEEIVVTARRREEPLQEVPISMTLLTSTEMEQGGIHDVTDLPQAVPGLQLSNSTTYSTSESIFVLRGQQAGGSQLNNDPAVALVVDGVIVPHSVGINGTFFDLERVEVLKGPQGTLFGRNTTGGVIQLISRKADYEGLHGYVGLEGGSDDYVEYRAAINVPIVDNQLAVRLGGQWTKRDGFGESAITGQDLGDDLDEWIFRGSLVYDPTERLRFTLTYDRTELRANGTLVTAQDFTAVATGNSAALLAVAADPSSDCGPFPVNPADFPAFIGCGIAVGQSFAKLGREDPYTNYTDDELFDDVNNWGGSLHIDFEITDDVSFRSITGFRNFWNSHRTDFDGSPFVLLTTGKPDFPERDKQQESNFWSQEFHLFGVALERKLDWLVGAYYSEDDGWDRDFVTFFEPLIAPYFFAFDAEVDQKSWAAFAQASYDLAPNWALTVGGRYTEETKAIDAFHATVVDPVAGTWVCGAAGSGPSGEAPAGIVPSLSDCSQGRRKENYYGTSWLVSVDWYVTDEVLLYLKASEGFRGGHFDIRSPTNPPFEAEEATTVEFGLKADWMAGLLRTNVALFTTAYDNKQETVIIPGPATVTQNAASATLDGAELEVFAYPLKGLSLTARVGWLQGEYDSFPGARIANFAANPFFDASNATDLGGGSWVTDASGEEFSNPEWTYSLRGRYEVQVGMGMLGFQLNYYWKDEYQTPNRRTDFAVAEALRDELGDSIGLLNARIDYDIPQYGINIALFGTNITDEEWIVGGVSQGSTGGMQTAIVQAPLQWGVSLTKSLGNE